jgi:uncharacterized protein YciI
MAWFLTQRRALKPRDEWTVSLDEHLVWMQAQHESGRIIISGPTPDRKVGMYLIRAKDRAEAETIASSDPYTAAGCTTFDLIEWEIHQILGAGVFTAKGLGH